MLKDKESGAVVMDENKKQRRAKIKASLQYRGEYKFEDPAMEAEVTQIYLQAQEIVSKRKPLPKSHKIEIEEEGFEEMSEEVAARVDAAIAAVER